MVDARVTVGGLKLANPLLLAPLAGITLPAVRLMYWKLGVGLAHTEMVSCAGLEKKNKKTARMLYRAPGEGPLVAQLFAGDVETMVRGAELALELGSYEGIGINMACPMPKVLKKGAGSRLLERPEIAFEMVRQLSKMGLPVWPKIRKIVPDGDKYPLDTLAFAEGLIEAGAVNVGIHGRTPAQRYEGSADKVEVCRVAREFPGCIAGSGDVYTESDVREYLENGCVAVFLARGAVADPFEVPRILYKLYNIGDFSVEATVSDRIALFSDLARDLCLYHGERVAMVLVKRFMSGIFRGIPGTGEYKRTVASTKEWEEFLVLLHNWRQFFERGLNDE